MAWDWLGEAWDLVTEVAEPVGKVLGLYDTVSNYGTTPGSEQARMLAEQDAGFNEGGWNVGGLFGLGKDIYSAYQAGEIAEQQLAPLQAQQRYYETVLPQLQAYYDPETARRRIRQEEERQRGLFGDIWSEEDARRQALARRRGITGSSIYDTAREKTLAKRGDILAGIRPSVESAYYAGPTGLLSGITNVGTAMGQQPALSSQYQNLLRAADPFGTLLTEYAKRV